MVLTVAVIKGGTGKSTTAAALAQAAAADGKKVLAVDLDPQANLSFFLGADKGKGSYDLLCGTPAAETIQETEQGIDIMAATADLAALKTAHGSARGLRKGLEPIKESYDLIIIDTPATVGEMHFNALAASDKLITPLEADTNGLQGFYQICDLSDRIRETLNPNLKKPAAIVARYDGRPKINRYLRDAIRQRAEERGAAYLGEIRTGIAIKEAQGFQESLYTYAPKSKPALDYMAVYKAICRQ